MEPSAAEDLRARRCRAGQVDHGHRAARGVGATCRCSHPRGVLGVARPGVGHRSRGRPGNTRGRRRADAHLAPLVRTDDEGAAGIRRLDAGDLGIRRGPIAPGASAIGRDRHGSPTGDAGTDGDPPRDVSVDRRHARPQRHDGRLDRHGGRLWRRRGGDRSARRRHRRPRCRLRPRSPRGVEAAGEPQHRPQQEHVDEQEQHQAHVGPAPCSAVASFTP